MKHLENDYQFNTTENILIKYSTHNYCNFIKSELLDYFNENGTNLNDFFSLAHTNSNLYILIYNLSDSIIDSFPFQLRLTLKNIQNMLVIRNNEMNKEAFRISKYLKEQGHKIIFLKGLSLYNTIYEQLPIRKYEDIDILASPETYKEIAQILMDDMHYFNEKKRDIIPKEDVHFLLRNGMFKLDLHSNILDYQPTTDINVERIITNAVLIRNNSNEYLYVPNCEDTIIYLCLYLYYCNVYKNRYRIKELSDIFNSLTYYKSELDWHKLIEYTKADRLDLPITYALYHTNLVYSTVFKRDIIPQCVLDTICPSNFDKERYSMKSTLKNVGTFAYWESSYLERIFTHKTDIDMQFQKEFFNIDAKGINSK